MLAISGLHVGSVAAVFFFLFSLVGKRIRFLLLRGRVKPLAALLCFLPVFFYGFVAGGSPSTTRAVIMVSVFLLTFVTGRQADLSNTLAAAALCILVVSPPCLFMVSFQFSFVAMLFLICSMLFWKKRDPAEGLAGRARAYVLRAVLVSVFISFGLAPLEMFHFNRITWAGLVMNPVLIPVFSFFIVPLCLMGVFFQMIWAPLAGACFFLGGLILKPCLALIQWMSVQGFAYGTTITPSPAWVVSCYTLVLVVRQLAVFYTNKGEDGGKVPVVFRRVAAGVCLAVFSVCAFQTVQWARNRLWDDRLKVTVLDVGKGSAALVELPQGVNFLVDGGGFSSNAIFDTGRWIVAPFLWKKGIRTIHYLVLSHPDTDHMNGLVYVARHFNCQQLWINGERPATKGFHDLMKAARQNNIAVVPKSGDSPGFFLAKGRDHRASPCSRRAGQHTPICRVQ